mmetsp:Transcript_51709/g.143175  ORF Transcript_51709/g.143175 Transcript_51709/m.143175 type:complete len:203 (+) Transcript_51709:837-1445(+)
MPDSQPCAARMRRCGTRAPPLAVVHKPARKVTMSQLHSSQQTMSSEGSARRKKLGHSRRHAIVQPPQHLRQPVLLRAATIRRTAESTSEALKAIAAPSSPRPRPAMRANSSANVATEHTTLTTSSARVSPIATKSFCSTHTIAAANWPGKRICAYKPACADTSGACPSERRMASALIQSSARGTLTVQVSSTSVLWPKTPML